MMSPAGLLVACLEIMSLLQMLLKLTVISSNISRLLLCCFHPHIDN